LSIAIIPARSGSQRIKKKNIKLFNGKPAIYWSILEAKKTKIFNKIIVSTDDKKIANLAIRYGALVPFIRSKKMSENNVSTVDVIKDTLLKLNIPMEDLVCCIYPVAPLMSYKDIIKSYKILKKNKKLDFIFPAATYSSNIHRAFYYLNNNQNKVKPVNKSFFYGKEIKKKNYKEKDTYHDSGQFYWGKCDKWIKKKDIFKSRARIIKIPRWRSQDINTEEDWTTAEKLFKIT